MNCLPGVQFLLNELFARYSFIFTSSFSLFWSSVCNSIHSTDQSLKNSVCYRITDNLFGVEILMISIFGITYLTDPLKVKIHITVQLLFVVNLTNQYIFLHWSCLTCNDVHGHTWTSTYVWLLHAMLLVSCKLHKGCKESNASLKIMF